MPSGAGRGQRAGRPRREAGSLASARAAGGRPVAARRLIGAYIATLPGERPAAKVDRPWKPGVELVPPMPARDRHHARVRCALEKDGWTVTHDPLHLRWGKRDLYVDLGAEQLLAAERGAVRIAVEIKMFSGASAVEDLQQALGQFVMYQDVLARREPGRVLYLAIALDVREELFEEPLGTLLLENSRLRLLVFDPTTEVITSWTPAPPTAT